MPIVRDLCPICSGLKDLRAKRCRKCAGNSRFGKGRERYISNGGYVMVWTGEYYMAEHRRVMEKSLGRRLSSKEHVHHKNHDRTDNRLENLELMSHSDHAREHFAPRAKELSLLGHQARWGT